jgi:hypothetical protein
MAYAFGIALLFGLCLAALLRRPRRVADELRGSRWRSAQSAYRWERRERLTRIRS